jgi:hypothetical protein
MRGFHARNALVGWFGLILVGLCGCASAIKDDAAPDAGAQAGSGNSGCGDLANCYSVYAHSDHTLYVIDLIAKKLDVVGPFKAPSVKGAEDVITDLAVAPDNTIYVVSETAIYTADPHDGHVTQVGTTSSCGTKTVALTTTPGGKVYAGDYSGALCEIDVSARPPIVKSPVTMSGGLALSGDLVAVDDGTVFGTAYRLSDSSGHGTQNDNLLVKVDLASGATTVVGGGSGFPKLYGTSYAQGKVFGFTHDGTGDVVTIDPTNGAGTFYATFTDPSTGNGISFAGAGVNSLVQIN